VLEFGREMTASKISERRLTGKELSSLAERMVNATDPAEETRIRESIGRGFYGQRENA
jgi:hypothetical protein